MLRPQSQGGMMRTIRHVILPVPLSSLMARGLPLAASTLPFQAVVSIVRQPASKLYGRAVLISDAQMREIIKPVSSTCIRLSMTCWSLSSQMRWK